MSLYGYDEARWGVTFIQTDSALSFEDRGSLLIAATEMYLEKQNERKVEGEEFEGVLRNTKERYMCGCFSGLGFEAEIETEHGKRRLSFLVTEKIRAGLN